MIQKCHASTATLILVSNFYNVITHVTLCMLNHLKLLCKLVHGPLEPFHVIYTSCQELTCNTYASAHSLSINPKTLSYATDATATATATATTWIRRRCARRVAARAIVL